MVDPNGPVIDTTAADAPVRVLDEGDVGRPGHPVLQDEARIVDSADVDDSAVIGRGGIYDRTVGIHHAATSMSPHGVREPLFLTIFEHCPRAVATACRAAPDPASGQ